MPPALARDGYGVSRSDRPRRRLPHTAVLKAPLRVDDNAGRLLHSRSIQLVRDPAHATLAWAIGHQQPEEVNP